MKHFQTSEQIEMESERRELNEQRREIQKLIIAIKRGEIQI